MNSKAIVFRTATRALAVRPSRSWYSANERRKTRLDYNTDRGSYLHRILRHYRNPGLRSGDYMVDGRRDGIGKLWYPSIGKKHSRPRLCAQRPRSGSMSSAVRRPVENDRISTVAGRARGSTRTGKFMNVILRMPCYESLFVIVVIVITRGRYCSSCSCAR